MDKELAQLEEWAVNLINDYEETLRNKGVKPSGPGGSEFKRIGRFSGELVANPEAYVELLDMARSQNMSAHELIKAIRTIEDLILGQKKSVRDPVLRNMIESMSWNPGDRRFLISDVIHHLFAQRTGGDTLRRLSQPERMATRTELRSEFGAWGNIPKNLKSLFRAWHTQQERATGIEAETFQSFGLEPSAAGQIPGTDIIHTESPSSQLITGTIPGETKADVLQGLREQFRRQFRATQATMKQVTPIVDNIKQVLQPYLPKEFNLTEIEDLTNEQLALIRNVSDTPEVRAKVQQAFAKGLSPYLFDKGNVTANMFAMNPASMGLKALMENPTGATVGALLDAYNKETIQKLETGDILGAGTDVAVGAGVGALVEAGAKAVGAQGLVGRIAAPTAGVSIFAEGREGSTTDYLLKKYGPKVGMNQQRPSWGTEIGEMQTEKPEYVQATEQALDWVGEKTIQFGKGVAEFVFGGIQQKQQERQQAEKSNLPYLPNIR